jgi:hypothetical protein
MKNTHTHIVSLKYENIFHVNKKDVNIYTLHR